MGVFRSEWTSDAGELRVLNITGVGGIGKSRFLKECQEHCGTHALTATLDLQIPALRQPDAALAVLRSQFGQAGVSFPRYDIAYLALWQRLHPHLRISLADVAEDRGSEVLQDLVESSSGIPLFRTVVGLLSLMDGTSTRLRRWRWLRKDETLQKLDTLDAVELSDAVTYLFAEDLRRSSAGRRVLLCIDAYEALVTDSVRAGRTAGRDAWLRDLVAQLAPGLVMIASREPLGWQSYDADWDRHLRHVPLSGLPHAARLELLAEGGIRDAGVMSNLASASSGLPFYLNLALDSATDPAEARSAVSGEELLERFLQHVHPSEVRLLEVLAAARIVDFGVFDAVATAFDLPGDRLTWERLVSYSFVQPVGPDHHQVHQLMAAALRERQTEAVRQAVHRALERLWETRARAAGQSALWTATAMREVLYHRLRTRRLDGDELVAHADAMAEAGGVSSLPGVVLDVRQYCRTEAPDRDDLLLAAHCVEAETALHAGNAEAAATLTSRSPRRAGGEAAAARLALAAADAQRLLGNTSNALAGYLDVWRSARPAERHKAGLWAADLYMATGRFRDAENLAGVLTAEMTPDAHRLRGDVARLVHLGRRFAFDLPASEAALREARAHYRRAGSVIGLGQLTVNHAELLAWADPGSADPVAVEAINTQTEFGAWHELGKAWTARALASLATGALEDAEAHLDNAFQALGRARYRSGLARARLVRALMLLRIGDVVSAQRAALVAVREFEETQVYPTLVLVAASALRQARAGTAELESFATRARAAVVPLGTLDELEGRIDAWTSRLGAGPT